MFTVIYALIVAIDLGVKFNISSPFVRVFSKALIVLSILLFYGLVKRPKSKKDYLYFSALSVFLIGDIALIFYDNSILFSVGLAAFLIAKLLLAFRFSNTKDFSLHEVIPILIFSAVYMSAVVVVVYDNLGDYFLPVIAYLFVSMILVLLAFLRRKAVFYRSFMFIMIGVAGCMLTDMLVVLQLFYDPNMQYANIADMVCYALFQYFVMLGLLIENEKPTKLKLV